MKAKLGRSGKEMTMGVSLMNRQPSSGLAQAGRGRSDGDELKGQAQAPVEHTPLIDIHEGPDGLVLEADLPGASDQTLAIEVEDNVLSLRARIESPVPKDVRVLHEEYRPGDFYRSFILSDEVDRERITAEVKNGVLRLCLPKAERAKTRRIEIKSS
jgi:HSP20 family molecular chaperone IbpA